MIAVSFDDELWRSCTYSQRHETKFNCARIEKRLKPHITFVDKRRHVLSIPFVMRAMWRIMVVRIHFSEGKADQRTFCDNDVSSLFTEDGRATAIHLSCC